MKYKPFSLPEALAGKPLITSNGKLVTRIAYFPEKRKYQVIALIGNDIRMFDERGNPFADGYIDDPTGALCMAPVKKIVFAAVYRDLSGNLFTGQKLHTEASAGFDPTVAKASNFVGMYSFEIED